MSGLGMGLRSHGCGELRREHVGQRVRLCGWVARVRDHGGLVFVDLRDRSGVVQLVFAADKVGEELYRQARQLRAEYVIGVAGAVRARAPETVNPHLPTGDVEVWPEELTVFNPARTPPFPIEDGIDTDELVRLRYRYLDLRRPEMQRNLVLRHRVIKAMRDFFDRHGFLEIETPYLTRSTPEGARDYLVPSRLYPGRFYALAQSPQIYKQLCMLAGLERYFQIARCFRDEDLRADRQPEFTQLDVEMAFVDQDDVLALCERMLAEVYRQVLGVELPLPLPRLTYAEAMARYGSDKPDLRFGLAFVDLSPVLAGTGFRVFRDALAAGGQVKALCVPGGGRAFSRKDLDELTEQARQLGAKGLAWLLVPEDWRPGGPAPDPGAVRSSFARFLTAEELAGVLAACGAAPGDAILAVADRPEVVAEVLGALRLHVARRLDLIPRDRLAFVWITEFPLLEWSAEEGRWVAKHHPFTAPLDEDLDLLERDPGAVRAKAYDLVLNGVELASGSIRIHRRDVQERVFRVLGMGPEEAERRFGFLLEAFEYGTPPHGGIAFGLDRLIMMMAGRETIRDVIAFPKTARAQEPMTGAPAEVDPAQLRELHLRLAVGPAAAGAAPGGAPGVV